jgi:signal transduction histidine kinase
MQSARSLVLALVVTVPCVVPALAREPISKHVLVLYSHEPEMEVYVPLDRGLRSTLMADPRYVLEFYSEYLDQLRFSSPSQQQALVTYLRGKYENAALDLVIAVSPPALEFLLANSDGLFGGVPVVFTSVNVTRLPALRLGTNMTGVAVRREFGDTIDLALRMQPGLRDLVIPVGSTPLERTWTEESKADLKAYESRVGLTYLGGTMSEITDRVRELPATAAVLFTPLFNTDAAGTHFARSRALAAIGSASSVPVYGTDETFLGAGIIGGALYDISAVGVATARMSLRILGGEAPARIPVEQLNPNTPMFDGRVLTRWSMPRVRLPEGSIVRFDQPTAWEQYGNYVIGFGVLFAIQFALITLLVVRTKRLKESQAQLGDVGRRLQHLARGLLLAREDERASIAREIHDVLGQALTALKMDVAWLGRRIGHTAEAHQKLANMEAFIDQTVTGVRRLATELRPGILDELGLVAAIEWQVREFENRTAIRCGYRTTIGDETLEPTVSTALFRIVQESLTNVARHSRATRVNVRLERHRGGLLLEVQDDGVGIRSDEAADPRTLGLAGMRERAQLIGGVFSIARVEGGGTAVRVAVADPRGAGA